MHRITAGARRRTRGIGTIVAVGLITSATTGRAGVLPDAKWMLQQTPTANEKPAAPAVVLSEEEQARLKEEVRKKFEAEERARLELEKREAELKALAEKKPKEVEKPQQQAKAEEKKQEKKPAGREPSLNLPIGLYIFSASLSGLGYLTGLLSGGAERDLRDPAKHVSQAETSALYTRAYYGGFVSRGFYGLSAALGGWAAYRTTSAVQDYIQAKASAAMANGPTDVKEGQEAFVVSAPSSVEPLFFEPSPPPVTGAFGISPDGDVSLLFSLQF